MVDEKAVRQKLYRQLKIELESHEQLHIMEKPIDSKRKLSDEAVEALAKKIDTSAPCQVQLRQLGKFVAKITLSGGYTVPLRFEVLKR
jgi:methionine aminopeptidase